MRADLSDQATFKSDAAALRKLLLTSMWPEQPLVSGTPLEVSVAFLATVTKNVEAFAVGGGMADKVKTCVAAFRSRYDVKSSAPVHAARKLEDYIAKAVGLMKAVITGWEASKPFDVHTSSFITELINTHHNVQQYFEYMQNRDSGERQVALCRDIADCVARDAFRVALKSAATIAVTKKVLAAKAIEPLKGASFKTLLDASGAYISTDVAGVLGEELAPTIVEFTKFVQDQHAQVQQTIIGRPIIYIYIL